MENDQQTQQREVWLSGQEARMFVRGGMACSTWGGLRQAQRDLAARRFMLDLTDHDVARLQVALLQGYAHSHPRDPITPADLEVFRRIAQSVTATFRTLVQAYVAAFKSDEVQAYVAAFKSDEVQAYVAAFKSDEVQALFRKLVAAHEAGDFTLAQ